MDITYRIANPENETELRRIAEADARVPIDFDPSYAFEEGSISARLDFYQGLGKADFFEVAVLGPELIGLHIIRKTPHPPQLFIGSIISLWVHPEHRRRGIARTLKARGEQWARASGLVFLQTHVHVNNHRMLDVNRGQGYEVAYLQLRKPL